MINKILFFTLSNFGDVILTLPVFDFLRAGYPDAKITVMVGPRAAEVFVNNPNVDNLIIYNKYAPLREKIRLFFQLKQQGFDVVIDLRNTLYGAWLPARFKTSPFLYMPRHIKHVKEQNLFRLKKALRIKEPVAQVRQESLGINQEDKDYINSLLGKNGIVDKDKVIIVSPATGGKTRNWGQEKFVQLCKSLVNNYSVILIGRKEDAELNRYIKDNCNSDKILNLSGVTNLAQLSCLLQKSSAVIVCDTGILHLASYLDIPIVSLFGPSDEHRFGPWSSKFRVLTSSVACRPCKKPDCRFNTVECMRRISVNEVLDSIDALLKA